MSFLYIFVKNISVRKINITVVEKNTLIIHITINYANKFELNALEINEKFIFRQNKCFKILFSVIVQLLDLSYQPDTKCIGYNDIAPINIKK